MHKNETVPELKELLSAFREKVQGVRLIQSWNSRENLSLKVLKSLNHAFNDFPQTGWIRGDSAASEQILEQANKALTENAELRAELNKLKSNEEPKYTDLADLDDEVELRYRTRYRARDFGDYSYTNRVCNLTWRKIFLALAANLKTSRTDEIILPAFRDAAKEAGLDYTPYELNSTDIIKIKIQFVAIGLIKASISTSTLGKTLEFLSLTARGREIFMNGMVVRKNKPIVVDNS